VRQRNLPLDPPIIGGIGIGYFGPYHRQAASAR